MTTIAEADPSAQLDAFDFSHCLLRDRREFARRLRGLRRRAEQGQPIDRGLSKLREAVTASEQAVLQRRSLCPSSIQYPPELPVSERRDEVAALIRAHQVVILCGETGSGKSTQLPKLCLDPLLELGGQGRGRGVFGRIGHTQPRRIAARSLASRVSQELGAEVGGLVGYKVRFHDRVQPGTAIKLLTDGMLLAEIQQDRFLNEYDTLIIDEAHERSLNIDFLLGYLKQLLPRRPDLKLIVTSATIDPQRFSRHFDDAPIIEISGRTYPVEVRYRPPEQEHAGERDETMQTAISEAVGELARAGRGDVLVFLSGEREIRETAETLRKHHPPSTEILPLYARQGPAEQAKVFKPHGTRRVVLATNVAETSLTVPGIHYVIDPGFARISRYSHRSKVQRLPVERVSRASADQRKGRCGRVASGICIRLYSEDNFGERSPFTEPEIRRTNLAAVILQMKLLGFGDIATFPFLDPPDAKLISDGYRTLEELAAIDEQGALTALGRQLARLPVDPRIGRMLLAAATHHCLREVLIIAAALSVQDPRERPLEQQQAADEIHATFRHPDSDFLAFLNLWTFLEKERKHLSKRKFQRLCKQHFLSWNRVQEWHDTQTQLREQLLEMGHKENQAEGSYEEIHRALLTGLLSNVGNRDERDYQGARNSRFHIHPSSALFGAGPKWVLCAERVETTRQYGRIAAKVQPRWIEDIGAHLTKRSYSEPHWQVKNGQVAAFETLTLFGLTVVSRRRVNYGPINPAESRELFLRFALTEGDFETRAPFWRHNRELIDYVHHLEAKSRRRDILVDDEAIHRFYAERVPSGIYSKPQFERWLRKATRAEPKRLHMRLTDVMAHDAAEITQQQFPDHLRVGASEVPLEYHFSPGEQRDGMTLVLPLPLINQLSPDRLDWLVPGLLEERITALLRGLPKQLRKAFVPIPETAARVMGQLLSSVASKGTTPVEKAQTKDRAREAKRDAHDQAAEPMSGRVWGDRPLLRVLGECLYELTRQRVPEDAWDPASLPGHLRMKVRVVDLEGRTLGVGEDLVALKRRLAHLPLGQGVSGGARMGLAQAESGRAGSDPSASRQVTGQVASSRDRPTQDADQHSDQPQRTAQSMGSGSSFDWDWGQERTGIRDWDFGPLPESVERDRAGIKLRGFPAILDQGDAVTLAVLDARASADLATRAGLRRLISLALGQDLRYLKRNLTGLDRMRLQYAKAPVPATGPDINPAQGLYRSLALSIGSMGSDGNRAGHPGRHASAAGQDLADELIALILDLCFLEGRPAIRDRAAFEQRIRERKPMLMQTADRVLTLVGGLLNAYQQVRKQAAAITQINWMPSVLDVREQLDGLIFRGFLQQIPFECLEAYPRYLKAISQRLDKLPTAAARDRERMQGLAQVLEPWQERSYAAVAADRHDERLQEIRWMLEEFRVSLFAQQLGTAYPISAKRIRARWQELGL